MTERPWIGEAGTRQDDVRSHRAGGMTESSGESPDEDSALALRLPEWDLVPPTEFVRRRGVGR